jgi:hypothetical protein
LVRRRAPNALQSSRLNCVQELASAGAQPLFVVAKLAEKKPTAVVQVTDTQRNLDAVGL